MLQALHFVGKILFSSSKREPKLFSFFSYECLYPSKTYSILGIISPRFVTYNMAAILIPRFRIVFVYKACSLYRRTSQKYRPKFRYGGIGYSRLTPNNIFYNACSFFKVNLKAICFLVSTFCISKLYFQTLNNKPCLYHSLSLPFPITCARKSITSFAP